jgi:hypothetical protein
VAFDFSPTMIRLALADPGPQDIDYEVLDWTKVDLEEKGWLGRFDLAFASRTPAISDLLSLKKMIQTVALGFGALVSSVDLFNSLRDPLMEKLALDPIKARAGRSVYLEINLLWLLGYYPEIVYFDQKWIAKRPLTEAIFNLTRYFGRLKDLTPAEKSLIAQSLTAKAAGDLVLEEVAAKTAVVVWEIPPRTTVDQVIVD